MDHKVRTTQLNHLVRLAKSCFFLKQVVVGSNPVAFT